MSQFHVSDENPNDVTGGKGCLCHPRGGDETRGPFIIFPATTTDDNLSPHAVLCEHCTLASFSKAEETEPAIDAEVVEELPEYVEPELNPELDDLPVIKI